MAHWQVARERRRRKGKSVVVLSPERIAEAKRGSFISFLLLGHLVLCSVAWVPEYLDRLGVSFVQWGAILGIAPLGAIASIVLAPRLLIRFGVRRVMVTGMAFGSITLAALGFITDPVAWAGMNLAFNFFVSLVGVTMNSNAVALQKRIDAPIMATLHAGWAVGAVLAAITGGLGTVFFSLGGYLVTVGLITTAVMLMISGQVLTQEEDGHRLENNSQPRRKFYRFPLALWLVALGYFAAVFPEIAILEWSAVFARDSLALDVGLRALPFGAFMGGMIVGRLMITRLAEKIPVHVLSTRGALLAAAAMTTTVVFGPGIAQVSPTAAIVFVGAMWLVAGLGIAPLGPSMMAGAGHIPGVSTAHAVSMVSFVLQVLSIGAKILMGAIAGGVSVSVAFALPIGLLLIGAWTAATLGAPRRVDDIDNVQPPTGPIPTIRQPE